jgi:Rod binding domain-containing protein
MTISNINASSVAAPTRTTDEKTLDTACHEFEGMLLGNILKQGILSKPDDDDEEQANGNNALLTEFAAEQTARALSRSDVTGIAALLTRQMRTPGT